MANKKNLDTARKVKNDEFYTQRKDVENELKEYEDQFRGKTIYCNCDDYTTSNFALYFLENHKRLGLKKVIITVNDFRDAKNIENLKECDIVVTNPPFSLFREFVGTLMKYKKKFLIIGNLNAITYISIFKLLKSNDIWLGGYTGNMKFKTPDNELKSFGNICWFTNIKNCKERCELGLTKSYTPGEYPKYDHYAAINVNRVIDIPMDYAGCIGVPITFLTKYNSSQFEIIDAIGRYSLLHGSTKKTKGQHLTDIGDKSHYCRIIIKKLDHAQET